ncbi:MAG: wax ester/triacylglycerol synthase family O-acyltransferase [Myxococcota bacterium]
MGEASYERLSAQDSSFLWFEGDESHVHVCAIGILESGPLLTREGGLDMDRIRAHVESRLHLLPHFRQRVAFTPIQRSPAWVDDERFDLNYHVRHTGLPQPCGEPQLKELAGRIGSQRLDRERPLWEFWFVEGLKGDRFALIAKVHHSMIDGVSGLGVLMALLSPTPDANLEPPVPWTPRPPPGKLRFLADEAIDGARLSFSALRAVGSALLSPLDTGKRLADTASASWQTLAAGFTPTAETPLNKRIGTQRRMDWCSFDLGELRDLKKRLDGTANDVLLGVVSGALRHLIRERRAPLKGLDVRVIIPVNTRSKPEDEKVGNRVSAWFLSMPLAERNPLRRFEKIRTQTRRLKRTNAQDGIDRFLRFADWSHATRLTFWGVNLVHSVLPYNLIVTNVQGPEFPVYLLGARLREFYPQLPLFKKQGLAVAAMSYAGQLGIGTVGDWDIVPDLSVFARALEDSFDTLRAAAEKRS